MSTDTTSLKAKSFKMTLDDEGTLITSVHVTSDALTPITSTVDGEYVDVTTSGIASFSASAQDNAAYHLISEGTVVLHGISKSDKVRARFAMIQAEELRLHILAESADVPRPKSSEEVRADKVAGMVAEGASQDDIIAALIAG